MHRIVEFSSSGGRLHGLKTRATVTLVVLSMLLQPAFAAAPVADNQPLVDPATERLIDGALRFLASRQVPNGAFHENRNPLALTAYGLIAFMAAGHLPNEGEYGRTVTRAYQYLLSCQRSDGYFLPPGGDDKMYGHGITTIALGELYGQTRDPNLRTRLEKAVNLIINTQNKEGGWRYAPRIADADVSVTVLQVVALRVAKNSGLDVPQETLDRAVAYVKSCYHEETGGFTYQPRQNAPGFARTAAAIYSLQVCGHYDDPMVKKGSEYLFQALEKDRQWFTYGNFYAAPAQYMIGGETWTEWYNEIKPQIISKVKRDSRGVYWQPLEGGQGVNEIYATSVYTTILAMPYHYLPLYQR
jgi:squalene cyclase